MSKGLKSKRLLTLSFLTVFVELIFKVQFIKASAIECGTTDDLLMTRINGGQKTERGEWPFLAALFLLEESKFFCGGTIISTKHVLTAAHCVQQKNSKVTLLPDDIAVLLGAYDLTVRIERHQIQREVSEIRVHPDWKVDSDKYDADICILVLSDSLPFTKYVRPVCMPADDTVIHGATGYIVGWGLEENELTPHIKFPKRAVTMSLNDSYCYTTDHVAAYISSQRTFCGRGEEQSPNKGDSGGGFFVLSSSAWVQYGIISALRANETGHVSPNSIAVYTNIKWFKSWILETTKQSENAVMTVNKLRSLTLETMRQTESAVMTVNESNKLKINLNCDYGFSDKKIYGCWLYDLDIRSENVEIASFSGTHAYKTTDKDVKLIQFRNGTIFYLPNEVGTLFKNLNTLVVGHDDSSSLRTKLISRSNLENLQNLIDLQFKKNDIETFDEDTLRDLPNLELFELSHNSLKVIDERTFEKNTKIREIGLHSNHLEFLPRNLFQNNVFIEIVNFGGNKLKEIDENTFGKNTKLREVYLHSNKLESLPRNLFKNNSLIEIVSFYENNLKEIDENTFEKNMKLREVYLYSNQLEILPKNLLQFNLLLEEVSFYNNKLKEIHENTFEKNTKLKKVYLNSNQLEFLSRNLFQNNLLLEEVDFSNNSLKIIEIKFVELKSIREMVFYDNVCIDAYYDGTNGLTEYLNEIRNLTVFQTLINENCSSANQGLYYFFNFTNFVKFN